MKTQLELGGCPIKEKKLFKTCPTTILSIMITYNRISSGEPVGL